MKRRSFLAIVAVSLVAVRTAPAATIFRITTEKVHAKYDVKVLKAKAGQITISMFNQGTEPHNVAIRAGTALTAGKALVTGKIVGKGGHFEGHRHAQEGQVPFLLQLRRPRVRRNVGDSHRDVRCSR